MNDIIKIIKSLEDLGVSIDVVTEIVKHEIKKSKNMDLKVKHLVSSVVKDITWRGVKSAAT